MIDWYLTKDGDKSCLELYERHYSAYRYKDGRVRKLFCGPGEKIVLRTRNADAMFYCCRMAALWSNETRASYFGKNPTLNNERY